MTQTPTQEHWLYGLSQVQALYQKRPQAIRVILYQEQRRTELAPLLQFAAKHKLPYRAVPDHELTAAASSVHHEGVCVKATMPSVLPLSALLAQPAPVILALDRIGNPHNLGAILRSAAYFGLDGILLTTEDGQARLSPAALRVAEGAGELLPVYEAASLGRAQVELKRRQIPIFGTDMHASQTLFETPLPRPCCIIMGNEHSGLSESTRRRCDGFVSIPGAATLDSLNVSVATGIVLAELFRQKTIPKKDN